MSTHALRALLGAALSALPVAATAIAPACREAVLLVHDSGGSPADLAATDQALRESGYYATDIVQASWGNASCTACNDHAGSEPAAVAAALEQALRQSCIGRIDVIAHGMGVTLAAQQVAALGVADRVDAFIAVGGALRGRNACGRYPFHLPTPSCGAYGLSVGSPLLRELEGRRFGHRVYSIKSYLDEWVCAGGCFVGGSHSSNVWGQDESWTFNQYGHLGLLQQTAPLQRQLLMP